MESDSKSQHGMETPTTSASENAPNTSARPPGVHPRGSLFDQLLREPDSVLPPTSGIRIADFQGSIPALPPGARAPRPPGPLPQDLLDLGIDVPDKEKTIREHVFWLMHNNRCRRREEQAGTHPPDCTLDRCRAMKDLVEHATHCTAGNQCPVTNCALTKGIFRHREICTTHWCTVCWQLTAVKSSTDNRSPPEYLSSLTTTTPFKPNLPTARLWHGEDPTNVESLRSVIRRKFLEGIFPRVNQLDANDPCMVTLIAYSRKVEAEMYEESSRENYCQLIAEKIYKVQKELGENRKRQQELRQMGTVGSAASGNSQGNMSPLAKELTEALQCRDADVQRKWMCGLFGDNPSMVAEFVEWLGGQEGGVALDRGKLLQEEKARLDDQKPAGDTGGINNALNVHLSGNQMHRGGLHMSNPLSNRSAQDNVMGPPSQGSLAGTSVVSPVNALLNLTSPPPSNSPQAAIMQLGPQTVAAKDWHRQVTGRSAGNMDSLRNHLIHKLVQTFFPDKDQSDVQARPVTDIISDARKVEAEVFEQANSGEEYYQLLAEQIYKIQKEQIKTRREEPRQMGKPSKPARQKEESAE